MGFFDFLQSPNINQGIERFRATPDAVLLDVRTAQEYSEGHIPDSQNLSLDSLDKAAEIIKNKNVPVFVYCYSGARSSQAAAYLKQTGYLNVENIGGISAWRGEVTQK